MLERNGVILDMKKQIANEPEYIFKQSEVFALRNSLRYILEAKVQYNEDQLKMANKTILIMQANAEYAYNQLANKTGGIRYENSEQG